MLSAGPLPDSSHNLPESERYTRTRELLARLDSALAHLDLCATSLRNIGQARDLSLCAHFRQADRSDGQPYINHPLEVALTLITKFGFAKPEAIIAALLHDTIEDQAHRLVELLGGVTTPERGVGKEALRLLRIHFGERVAEMVSRLTNPDFHEISLEAQLRGDPRTSTELTCHYYKEHFLEILERDPEAFLVKLSDFSLNAFALSGVVDDAKRASLKAKYGPVLLTLADRLHAIPHEGHVLTPWRESLPTELLWVYARDYSYM